MADDLFEIRDAPNDKGRGLFAKQKIAKGKVILQETMLAIFLGDVIQWLDDWRQPEIWQALVRREEEAGENHGQIGRLVREYIAEASAEGFDIDTSLMARAHPEFQNQDVNMFLTNRLRTKYGNHQAVGLGRYASIINHSCISNAHLSSTDRDCPPNREKAYVKATKDIAQGEEINITYLGVSDWVEERRQIIAHFFKFDCSCDVCSNGNEDREILLHKCHLAHVMIGWSTENGLADRAPWAFFRNAWTICGTFVHLGVNDWREAQILMDCAEVAAHYSDAVRARHFWESVREWHRLASHENCEEHRWFATLIKKPELHREWGKSTLGISGPEYDPIEGNYQPGQATIKLLFMMDYQTDEYRRIGVGADREMSEEARAQLDKFGHDYAAVMEEDAAEAAANELLAEEDEEEKREAAKLEKARKKREKEKDRKKAKKERKQGKAKAKTANNSDDGQSDEVEPLAVELVQENNQESSPQPALGSTDGEDGWTTVQKNKGKGKTKTNTPTNLESETRGGVVPPATSTPPANNPTPAIRPPLATCQQPTTHLLQANYWPTATRQHLANLQQPRNRQQAARPANRQPPVGPKVLVNHSKPGTRPAAKMTKPSVVTAPPAVAAAPPAAASSLATAPPLTAAPPPAVTPPAVATPPPAAGPSTNTAPLVVKTSFAGVAPGAKNAEPTNNKGMGQSSDTTAKVHNAQGPTDSLNNQAGTEQTQTHGLALEPDSNYATTVTDEEPLQAEHLDNAEDEPVQSRLSVEERTIAAFLNPSVRVLPIITSYRPRAESAPPRLVTPPNRNDELHAEIHGRLALLQRLRLYAAQQMEEVNQLQLQLE